MNNRTKLLQFDKAMADAIFVRDNYSCIFCIVNYRMPDNKNIVELQIKDPMHFMAKSHGGLGIRKNGGCGCRYHHNMYDHIRDKNQKEEMIEIFMRHLKSKEPGWDIDDVIYKKGMALNCYQHGVKQKFMQHDIFGGSIDVEKIQPPKFKRMTMKEAFRSRHGYKEGLKCVNCSHFYNGRYNNKNFYKCKKLGVTSSIATDIRKKDVACNLFE